MTINGGNTCNRIVALLSLGFLYLTATQQPVVCAAEFFGLGLTTPGATYIYQYPDTVAIEASNDGQVVSGQQFGRPFQWTRQTGAVLLDQKFPSYSWFDEKPGMSGDGSVMVGNLIHTSDGIFVYRWTETTGTVFIGKGEAWGVSQDGSTIVGSRSFYDGPPPPRMPGFRWTAATGFADLSPPSEYPWHTAPTAVSGDGSIVVGGSAALEPSVVWKALRWTDSSVPEILTDGMATAVTPNGQVVVGLTNPTGFGPWNGTGEAFRWTEETGAVTLGVLPGMTQSDAQDVSADGQRIVGRSWNYNATSVRTLRSFLWDPIHGMRDLQTVLETEYGLGSELAGWKLEHAIGISDDGTTIVGSGVNPSGNHDSWIARIDPIPEPSTIALLVAVAVILAFAAVSRKRLCHSAWLLLAVISFRAADLRAAPIEWPTAAGGNGHFYEQVPKDPTEQLLSWHEAQALAAARSWLGTAGRLATINSQSEYDFVYQNVYQFPDPDDNMVWLGGFQNTGSPSYSEPAGGWTWITGEPWTSFWRIDEPNNSPPGEDYLTLRPGGFNDVRDTEFSLLNDVRAYVVEYPVPEPSTLWLALLTVGAFALFVWRQGKAVGIVTPSSAIAYVAILTWACRSISVLFGLTQYRGFLVEFPVTVPEPSTILLSLLGTGCWIGFPIRKSSGRRSAADP